MSEFKFIAVRGPRKSADSTTRKLVRQHVAKQHGKKQRLEDVKRYQGLRPAGSKHSWLIESKTKISPLSVVSSVSTSIASSPKTMLSASRGDPFDVFPIPMQKLDLELVDFWMNDLTRDRYGPEVGERFIPMRDLFLAQAVEHEASIHGLLFLAASWMSAMRPPMAAQSIVKALHHRGQLLEQINSAIARSAFDMPGLIQAIGFQIVYEGVLGGYLSCRRHLIGMRSIVLAMGGPVALSNEPRVQMIFIYLSLDTGPDYLPLPLVDSAYTPYETKQPVSLLYQTHRELEEVNAFINDLIAFLCRITTLSEQGWLYHGHTNPFGPTTLLNNLLSPKPSQPSDSQGVLGQHRTTRMACLLLLCNAFLALDAPSQACDGYVTEQVNVLLLERADMKADLRPFLHLLIKDTRAMRLRDLDVAYTASKHSQIIKRLSIPMHDKVSQILFGCLAAGGDTSTERLSAADFQTIRDEALMFQPP